MLVELADVEALLDSEEMRLARSDERLGRELPDVLLAAAVPQLSPSPLPLDAVVEADVPLLCACSALIKLCTKACRAWVAELALDDEESPLLVEADVELEPRPREDSACEIEVSRPPPGGGPGGWPVVAPVADEDEDEGELDAEPDCSNCETQSLDQDEEIPLMDILNSRGVGRGLHPATLLIGSTGARETPASYEPGFANKSG